MDPKFVILMVLITTSIECYAGEGFICSRATYYGSPECHVNPSGACGFGEYGKTVNNGEVSGVSRLYKNGSGCGACYQVRCKIPTHCTEDGTKLVVTDYGQGDHTDFILSPRAYANLAKPTMANELYAYGVIDIEYQRVPCQYSSTLLLKVKEHSHFPGYIAVVPMYQGGDYDVTAAEVWVEDCKEWKQMRRPYGAVWDMQNPPMGPLNLRFQVNSNAGEEKWVQIASVIPGDWKAGVTYDTTLQLN